MSKAACAYLAALSLIFAYAVFASGGIVPSDWNRCLVALGLLTLVYFRFTKKDDLAPPLQSRLMWPSLLLLAYVALQLVPLPLWLLRALSPARAALVQFLNPITPGTAYAPISVFPSATLAHLLRIAAYIVVFVLTRELAWRTLERRWLIAAPIVIIAGANAVAGVFQYSPPDSVAHGTYVNRNHFAGLLELSLPFALAYPMATVMKRRRLPLRRAVLVSISLALATLMLLGVILSLSRGGFLASLAALFVVGFVTLSGRASLRRRLGVAAAVAATLAVISLYVAPDLLIGRFGEVRETLSDAPPDARAQVWRDTWALVRDYPLVGCGLGAFAQAFPRYRTFLPQLAIDTVHNDYLQFLAELGVIGFAIAAAGMTILFVSAADGAFRNADLSSRYIAIACLAALVAILIHSFTDYNLYIPANAMLVAWIAGIVASLNCGSKEVFTT
jgi:O-antigen ligase